MPDVQVKWVGNLEFVGTDTHKHSVVMSSHDEANGTGMSPFDLVAVALGGCSGMDIVEILQKKGQALTDLKASIQSERETKPPHAYKKINVEYVLRGRNLSKAEVERAIELSETKYCGVRGTLAKGVEITSTYRIEEEGT